MSTIITVAAPVIAAECGELKNLKLAHTTIAVAENVAAGSFKPPGRDRALANASAFCRVAGSIKPSSDSDIRFEVWLPAANWNGKFQGIGNGGYAGTIGYDSLGAVVSRGYATASTDTGHAAEPGGGAGWALGHPEKVIDFGHRAIHETAVVAKAVIKAHFGEGPRRSYFNSCSNGGRQALMEAQRYPEDYDGIVAGAPANYWTRLLTMAAAGVKATLAKPESYVPESKLPALQSAVISACDSLDGLKDGLLQDPSRCKFDPGALLCNGAESDACLTAPQVATLRSLYAGLRNARGEQLFPAVSSGGEAERGGWGPWITGAEREKSAMFMFGTHFFKNIVYEDPAWDFRSLEVDRDLAAAERKSAAALNATNPDLAKFYRRGGKLILYHGWSDAAIPAVNAIDYYKSVVSKMGDQNAAGFVRLFMVPGMQHCAGGSGPSSFGQQPGVEGDPSRDIDAALERWVEEGKAPEVLIAATGANAPVRRTRPLCAYPLVAKWNGQGSIDDAANFTCAQPDAPGSK